MPYRGLRIRVVPGTYERMQNTSGSVVRVFQNFQILCLLLAASARWWLLPLPLLLLLLLVMLDNNLSFSIFRLYFSACLTLLMVSVSFGQLRLFMLLLLSLPNIHTKLRLTFIEFYFTETTHHYLPWCCLCF